jgi:hypothetical protein
MMIIIFVIRLWYHLFFVHNFSDHQCLCIVHCSLLTFYWTCDFNQFVCTFFSTDTGATWTTSSHNIAIVYSSTLHGYGDYAVFGTYGSYIRYGNGYGADCCESSSTTATCSLNFTQYPTEAPSAAPSFSPIAVPTVTPTYIPSAIPSVSPTQSPSATPTFTPTASPSATPTETPSVTLTASPSYVPSVMPTMSPSATPTKTPSRSPSVTPTIASDSPFLPVLLLLILR